MEYITIGNKKLPYILSHSATRIYLEGMNDKEKDHDEMLLDLAHEGLRCGRLALPLFKRLFYIVPSKRKLSMLIGINQLQDLVKDMLPKTDGEPVNEGKPLAETL